MSTAYTGGGVLYAVLYDDEDLAPSHRTSTDVLAAAIEEHSALDSVAARALATHLLTGAFRHISDPQARYSAILRASDATGAHTVRMLRNFLRTILDVELDAWEGDRDFQHSTYAAGFAAAMAIAIYPHTVASGYGQFPEPQLVLDLSEQIVDDTLSEDGHA